MAHGLRRPADGIKAICQNADRLFYVLKIYFFKTPPRANTFKEMYHNFSLLSKLILTR